MRKRHDIKILLCLLCMGLSGLLWANAHQYTAILLDKNGNPRCKIEGRDGPLDKFKSELAIPNFDTLRTCNERDEIYAKIALGAEEIQIAGIISSYPMKTIFLTTLALAGIDFAYICQSVNTNFSTPRYYGTATILIVGEFTLYKLIIDSAIERTLFPPGSSGPIVFPFFLSKVIGFLSASFVCRPN